MGGTGDRTKLIALGVFALIAAVVVAAILISRAAAGDSSATRERRRLQAGRSAEAEDGQLQGAEADREEGRKLTAVVDTSCGTFDIALDTGQAPKTVNSFAFLAAKASTTASTSTALRPAS